MLVNFFKIAFRNLVRHKSHSIINISGLAVGLATFILISIFVQHELSYDRHYDDSQNLYRLEVEITYDGEQSQWAATQGNWVPRMLARYPEIQSGTRILKSYFPQTFNYDNTKFSEPETFFADSSFFEIFTYEIIRGDENNLLNAPYSLVINERVAKKYFGDEDPIGKKLQQDENYYTITGVCAVPPETSHFHFDFLISLGSLAQRWPDMDEPGPNAFHSYIRLYDKSGLKSLDEKIQPELMELWQQTDNPDEEVPEGMSAIMRFISVPDIHLHSNREKELEANGSASIVIIFSTIAVMVLLIACINYVNLTTARSIKRAREVGVRKVVGATRRHIFFQFLSESLILTAFALLLALAVVQYTIPIFSEFTGKSLALNKTSTPWILLSMVSAYFVTSLLSGP